MKLGEILITATPSDSKRWDPTKYDLSSRVKLGPSEMGLDIYTISHGVMVMYALFKQDTYIASVCGHPWDNYFVIVDTYVVPEFRRMGYITTLYIDLIKRYNIKLMSDIEQTPNGKLIWDALKRRCNISSYNMNTTEILPVDSTPGDIYSYYPDDGYRYRLIAEAYPPPPFEITNPTLNEWHGYLNLSNNPDYE